MVDRSSIRAALPGGQAGEVALHLYSFRSTGTIGLRAFTSDRSGERLPAKCGPWALIGHVLQGSAAPYGLERSEIEKGISREGFQLWRMKAT